MTHTNFRKLIGLAAITVAALSTLSATVSSASAASFAPRAAQNLKAATGNRLHEARQAQLKRDEAAKKAKYLQGREQRKRDLKIEWDRNSKRHADRQAQLKRDEAAKKAKYLQGREQRKRDLKIEWDRNSKRHADRQAQLKREAAAQKAQGARGREQMLAKHKTASATKVHAEHAKSGKAARH